MAVATSAQGNPAPIAAAVIEAMIAELLLIADRRDWFTYLTPFRRDRAAERWSLDA